MKIKKYTKSLISLIMALSIIMSCSVTGAFVAQAETTNEISLSKSGIVGGSITSSRYDGNTFNIVNDGVDNNTTVGMWSYDTSDIQSLTSAQLTATVTKYSKQNIDGLAVDFYYVNPESVSTYLKDKSASDKLTNIDGIASNAGSESVAYIKNTFGLSDKNLIGSLSHNYSSDGNTEFTLDLTTAFHDMKDGGWSGLCIIAMCNKNNGASASNPIWSDSWISLGNITYTTASKTLSLTKSAIVTAGSGNDRYNGNSFNIVNDGTNSNLSIGLWSFDTSGIKYVDEASVNVFIDNWHTASIDELSIDFYYVEPAKATSYLKELSVSNKTATEIELSANTGDGVISWATNKFKLTQSSKIGSISHNYTSSVNRHARLDLTAALNKAKQEKWNEVVILAVCNKNNNGTSSHLWSDSWVELSGIGCEESSSYVPLEKSGILCGENNSGRFNGNTFNIVNDSLANNTTVGLWSYDISDIKADEKAGITVTTTKRSQDKIDNFGIEFYWVPSSTVSSYLKPLTTVNKLTVYSGIANNAGSGCVSYLKGELGLDDNNKIAYLEHDYTDDQNKYFTLDLTGAIKSAKDSSNENITIVALCNRNNDGNSSAKWSDAWLELGGINYGSDLTLAQVQPLKSAMSEFESKMANGKIYKNMGVAYTAYVNAQKAIDAYAYGKVKSISISEYTDALKNATAAMTEWSAPNPTQTQKFSTTDSGAIPINTGCLWYEYSDDPIVKSYGAEGNNTTANFYYQNGVYLYTDSSPNIPYTVGFYRSSNLPTANPQNPRVFYVSLTEQDGGLTIKNAQYQGDVSSREFSTIMNKSYQINSTAVGDDKNIILSTSDMRYMANYFNINYQSAFANNSNYYVEAKPTKFSIGIGYKDAGNSVQWVKEITGVDSKTFYVINYKSLLDKINSASYKALLKNISAYKQGGLSDLMQAYDTATNFDPSSYDYSSSTKTKVANCATDIKDAVNKFNQASSLTRDNTVYNDLRSALNLAKSTGDSNPVISGSSSQSTRYTAESWSTYYTALTQGQSAMADVFSSNGYSGTYNSKTVSAIASEITAAASALKYNYIVEYISVSGQRMGTLVLKEGESANGSNIVNTATVKGVQDRKAHICYSWDEVTADRSVYGDKEVITVNEKSTEEACTLTPGEVVREATCDTPGLRQYTCDICGAVYENETEKTEHSYTSKVIPSTCTERGYTLYTCENCGNTYKDNYTELAEHKYESVTVEPTCTEKGYTAQRCTVCSHEIIDENSYVAALGHKYEYSVIREADCTFKGVGEYVCIRHDHSYTEEIKENDHNHPVMLYSRTVAPTASEEGYDIYYCANLCGYWEKRNITPATETSAEFADCLEAYNASLKTIVDSFEAYTEESQEAYTQAINEAKAKAETAIESEDIASLDKATTSIIEATSLLRVKIISVKLQICNANGEITQPQTTTQYVSYGEPVTFDVTNEIGDMNVEKWTVKKNGVTKKVSQSSAVYELVANEDAIVKVYLTKKAVPKNNKIKLTLLNNNGRVIETKYISASDELDTASCEIAGVTAPKLAFYSFKEWKTVSADENEIVLRATYEVI